MRKFVVPALMLLVLQGCSNSVEVSTTFPDGRGLEAGDAVRLQGVAVGEVESVDPAQAGVGVTLSIEKKQAELQLEREKMVREDDRRRDKDEADILLKAAELEARFGAQIDMAQIKANAERDREVVRQLASTANGQNRTPVS